jgi:hypothetical protein
VNDQFYAVRHERGDSVAWLQAESQIVPSQIVDIILQIHPCSAGLGADQRDVFGVANKARVEQVMNVDRFVEGIAVDHVNGLQLLMPV